jgi:hypothetical protein
VDKRSASGLSKEEKSVDHMNRLVWKVEDGTIVDRGSFFKAVSDEIKYCIEGCRHNVCCCPPSFCEKNAKAVCYLFATKGDGKYLKEPRGDWPDFNRIYVKQGEADLNVLGGKGEKPESNVILHKFMRNILYHNIAKNNGYTGKHNQIYMASCLKTALNCIFPSFGCTCYDEFQVVGNLKWCHNNEELDPHFDEILGVPLGGYITD